MRSRPAAIASGSVDVHLVHDGRWARQPDRSRPPTASSSDAVCEPVSASPTPRDRATQRDGTPDAAARARDRARPCRRHRNARSRRHVAWRCFARDYTTRSMTRLVREGVARGCRRSSAAGHARAAAPGCGDPSALIGEIMRQAERLAPLTLMGGLRLDDYPFAAAAYAGKLRFATWHSSPRLLRRRRRAATWTSSPRATSTRVSLFAAGGPWAPDAVLVHTAPPDAAGYLCPSACRRYPAAGGAAGAARDRRRRTSGCRARWASAFLHRSQIDCWVETDQPLRGVSADARSGTSSGGSPPTSPS